jgi:hypothetical protein
LEASYIPSPTGATDDREQTAVYEQCEHCGAPVDQAQRYCVSCGAHRRHVHDPAARYLTAVSASARAGHRAAGAVGRGRRPLGLAMALLLAVVPLAVGLGVLVGRASTSGDQQLIAALRSQKPEIITAGGGVAGSSTTPVSTSALTSDFPLQSGYAVELSTLPASGTDQASVTSAERAARAKGASHVGLITQHDFHVTPSPPPGAYVIYSGAYGSKALADQALAKLGHRFPGAKVIRVQASGTSGSPAGGGKVLTQSVYGTAHQIAGSTPNAAQLATGRQLVQQIQQTQGKSYVNAQRGLPDQISIP